MASLALVLLGCSDNSNSLVSSNEQANSSVSLSKMGEDLHSATGNAHWKMIGYQTNVRFSFSAVKHADGSTSGEVRNNDEGPTLKFHGKVYDLLVEGNRAKICFTFLKGSVYSPPGGPSTDLSGWLGCVVVIDGGEGKSANGSDVVSLIEGWWPGFEYEPGVTVESVFALGIDAYLSYILDYYDFTYDFFMPAIGQGSVQVR